MASISMASVSMMAPFMFIVVLFAMLFGKLVIVIIRFCLILICFMFLIPPCKLFHRLIKYTLQVFYRGLDLPDFLGVPFLLKILIIMVIIMILLVNRFFFQRQKAYLNSSENGL